MTTETDDKPTFTQEDLSHIADDGADADAGKDAGGTAGGAGGQDDGDKGAGEHGKAAAGTGGVKTTVASGDEADEEKVKAAAEKADADKAAQHAEQIKTFREQLAKHASAGDKKAYDKELKRLERLGIERPEQVYGLYRELDNRLNGGGLIKVPGKDAKPEEIAEYHKAIGVPEKAEDYLKDLKLENGAVIGDADKPIVGTFADALHKAGAPPSSVKAALNWYYGHLAQVEADQADADDASKRENTVALKEELGASFRREMVALKSLFDTAPGGADDKNASSLYSRMMTARTNDGKLLGNDPDFLRQLMSWRQDIRPFATVTEDGAGSARSAEARLEELKALRKSDSKKYWSPAVQQEELALISAIEKGKVQATA